MDLDIFTVIAYLEELKYVHYEASVNVISLVKAVYCNTKSRKYSPTSIICFSSPFTISLFSLQIKNDATA